MQWRIIAKVSIWIYLSTEIHKKFSIKLQMQMQSQWNVQNINTWWLEVVEGDSLHPSLDTHGAGSHCRVTMSLHCSLATLYHRPHIYSGFSLNTATASLRWRAQYQVDGQYWPVSCHKTPIILQHGRASDPHNHSEVWTVFWRVLWQHGQDRPWCSGPGPALATAWSAQFCSAGREAAAQFVLLSSPSFCLVFVNLPGNWTEFTELTQLSWMHTVRESAAIWPLSPDIQNIYNLSWICINLCHIQDNWHDLYIAPGILHLEPWLLLAGYQ